MTSFNERNQVGQNSESIVRRDLESRGWTVDKYGRDIFSAGFNRALTNWRDTHSDSCGLCQNPDFAIWTPESRQPSNLFLVEVKRITGGVHIARVALRTYVAYEDNLNTPTIIVFHFVPKPLTPEQTAANALKYTPAEIEADLCGELKAIAAGKARLSAVPHDGNPDAGSGQPMHIIDRNQMSPMERFFGPKRSER